MPKPRINLFLNVGRKNEDAMACMPFSLQSLDCFDLNNIKEALEQAINEEITKLLSNAKHKETFMRAGCVMSLAVVLPQGVVWVSIGDAFVALSRKRSNDNWDNFKNISERHTYDASEGERARLDKLQYSSGCNVQLRYKPAKTRNVLQHTLEKIELEPTRAIGDTIFSTHLSHKVSVGVQPFEPGLDYHVFVASDGFQSAVVDRPYNLANQLNNLDALERQTPLLSAANKLHEEANETDDMSGLLYSDVNQNKSCGAILLVCDGHGINQQNGARAVQIVIPHIFNAVCAVLAKHCQLVFGEGRVCMPQINSKKLTVATLKVDTNHRLKTANRQSFSGQYKETIRLIFQALAEERQPSTLPPEAASSPRCPRDTSAADELSPLVRERRKRPPAVMFQAVAPQNDEVAPLIADEDRGRNCCCMQ